MSFPRFLLFAVVVRSLAGQTTNAYVDAQLCATCHAKIAKTYALTGMARSFSRAAVQNSDPYFHERSGTWYSMVDRDGKNYQRRWRIGFGGKEIDVQESRIDYVMGSGNHARTYLHRTERGALIELPLGWYSENGGTWAMSPGYDRDYSLPPNPIAYECMSCHNAYPRIPAGHDEPGSEPLYSDALPEGIDCQRCHGPGGNHVRAAQNRTGAEAVRAAIVNPARLAPDRQMEVCMQCHLETTSLRLPHSLQKYGRGPFSYRPGEPLRNFMIFFDHAPGSKYDDDFEIAHSAYRLRKSQCFLKSGKKLTCTTCHDPHDIPRGEQAAAHYNGVCGSCHAALREAVASGKHTAASGCVGCHMPKRRTQDVVHAVMTDHLIQRRAPSRDLLAPLAEREEFDASQYRGKVVAYYPPLSATGLDALYAAVAQVTQKSNLAKGLPRLSAEIAKQRPAAPEFYIELGQAWLSAGKPANAIGPLEEALRREPNSPVAALNLADALTQAQPARAVEVLKRAIKVSPNDALLWYQLGLAHSSAGRESEAMAAFEKSAALDPDLAEPHNLLGAALAATGDLDRAQKEFLAALQIYPDLAEAQGNLGHLLAARGELGKAAFYFARSVHLKPNDAEVRTNYSVTLARLNQFDEARRQIDAAVKLNPKSPEAHNFRGTLCERAGNHDDALKEFLEAIKLRPDFGLAHLNAGLIFAAKRETAAAEQHLRAAAKSDDPAIQKKAGAALEQLGVRR
jgi:predicted CXXCH cytochrome family protein